MFNVEKIEITEGLSDHVPISCVFAVNRQQSTIYTPNRKLIREVTKGILRSDNPTYNTYLNLVRSLESSCPAILELRT